MITINYYIVAGISVLCLIVSLLHLQELDLISKKSIKSLRFMACFIVFEIIIDTLFKTFEGIDSIPVEVLYVLKAIELMMNPILPFLILKLFEGNNNSLRFKWIKMILLAIIFINIGLQFVSLFGNYMFYIDESNLYHRTPFTIAYVVALVSSMGLMVLVMYAYSVKAQNTNILTLCGLCLLLISGIVLRLFFPNTNFDWLCISISFFVIDIYYVDAALRLDPLTHLLNRQVYTTLTSRINFSTAIIMIDANNLKIINDSYGHECGDKTLQIIAKAILKTYHDYGWCFRIGGDEFCVILKSEPFKTLVDNTPRSDMYLMCENLMKRLDERIKRYSERDEESCLIYGVAQGYGIYYAPLEYPSILDKQSIEEVTNIADKMMYARKEKIKKELSESQSFETQKESDEYGIKRLNSAN